MSPLARVQRLGTYATSLRGLRINLHALQLALAIDHSTDQSPEFGRMLTAVMAAKEQVEEAQDACERLANEHKR